MTKKRFAVGQAVGIGRLGFGFLGIKTGAEGVADAFCFSFAGGTASGDSGTYQVYQSMDGDTDPYELVDGLEVEVVSGIKTKLPSDMFNVGWIKLVGSAGLVNVYGAG